MKVLVAVKSVADPDVRIRVAEDHGGVDLTNVPMTVNPFDAIAIEQAVRWKESGIAATVAAVSVGGSRCTDVLRHAMAMGADRAIHADAPDGMTPLPVARTLHAIVLRESPDLILMGKQAVDYDCNQTGQMLAALLGWPQATFASHIEIEGGRAVVTREVDSGLEVIEADLPCVITTDLRLNEPRFASLPNVLKARKAPIETYTLVEIGVSPASTTAIVRVDVQHRQRAGLRLGSVGELVGRLRESGELA